MATASNVNLTILRDVANANATVTYTVNWSAFDQASNLQYSESIRFMGDDGQAPTPARSTIRSASG